MTKPVHIFGITDPHDLRDVLEGLLYIGYVRKRKAKVPFEKLVKKYENAAEYERKWQKELARAKEFHDALAARNYAEKARKEPK